ncbi:FecR domain-containing protein [Cytophaga sp. FL35]|uniref:FecR family protein n=1 Tax=Cytophaga sp. FL35 TaxID=1904456 RepID=UPI0016538939|nr:FecR domain-containing protein [Cytophaga sp. FL35]MBC7000562.1 FecR domain-containing protein [Cytophaga sp. FL35]
MTDFRSEGSLTDFEKLELKRRVLRSVKLYRRRKAIFIASGLAASLALVITLGLIKTKNPSPSIVEFAEQVNEVDNNISNKVTLILSEGENLSLEEDNPEISYTSKNGAVDIGSSQLVEQQKGQSKSQIYNTLMVPYGQRSKILLSDGSQVWLNSGSKLIYPIAFETNKREVFLEGEAIFEVTHNESSPFHVITKNQKIEVLGTVFNVNDYKDEATSFTVLKQGSVMIRGRINNADGVLMKPGTKASIRGKSEPISTETVDVKEYFSWREGLLIIKNDPLSNIMRKLSRYYNRPIQIESSRVVNETFSGYLDLKTNLEEVLGLIQQTANIEYKQNENGIIIITLKK